MTQVKEQVEIKPLALTHRALAYELGMTDAHRHAMGRKTITQTEADKRTKSIRGWGLGFNKGMEIERSKKNGYQSKKGH